VAIKSDPIASRFDDPALGIKWPDVGVTLTLSPKDQKHPLFADIEPCVLIKQPERSA